MNRNKKISYYTKIIYWVLGISLVILFGLAVRYKLTEKATDDTDYMTEEGYSVVEEQGEYTAYYKSAQEWTITQYASDSGNQAMIYTIEDDEGHLILVDGGWDPDKEQVLNIIQNHNNHVDAWIITHPDADHVGAFNAIFGNPGAENITVDTVYFPDVDHDTYAAEANWWDGFGDYETFIRITQDWDNVVEVKAGDHYDILNLKFDFFNSYSNRIDGTDAINDGSLLFKVSGKSRSMLFCADVGVGMSEKLIEQWGDELKADYIQMGHHGNGGLNEDFYRLVNPKIAFFDAPEWLFHPADGTATYDTEIKAAIMESMGATIYYYATAPNKVTLK